MLALIKKEFLKNVFSLDFLMFFIVSNLIIYISFKISGFFSGEDDLKYLLINFSFFISVILPPYAGFLGASAFASEFEYGTFPSLIVAISNRQKVFLGKIFSSIIISLIETSLLLPTIYIILSLRGSPPLHIFLMFVQILGAVYLYSLAVFLISVWISEIFRRSAYAILGSTLFGLLVVPAFIYVFQSYNPGFNYLHIDMITNFFPFFNPAYATASIIEYGSITAKSIYGSLIWLPILTIITWTEFRRCEF